MPTARAASVSAGSTPSGGARVWVTGSSTPKNISPMPTPAANSMASHAE